MTYLKSINGGSAQRELAGMIFLPIALCSDEAIALDLEHHFITTTQPSPNDPDVSALLARKGFVRGPHAHKSDPSWTMLRRAPRRSTRGTQLGQHPQDNHRTVARLQSNAPLTMPPAAYWAAAACNQLKRSLVAQIRRQLWSLSPAKWFATWHYIRRREAGVLRGIGLAYMERIRKFMGSMRPSASAQLSLPSLPRSDIRTRVRSIMGSIFLELYHQGAAILLQAQDTQGLRCTGADRVASQRGAQCPIPLQKTWQWGNMAVCLRTASSLSVVPITGWQIPCVPRRTPGYYQGNLFN